MTITITLEMPHTVFVIVAKDRRGYKRGFEKVVDGRIHLEYSGAVDALRNMGIVGVLYTIEEAVIGYPVQEAEQ